MLFNADQGELNLNSKIFPENKQVFDWKKK